MLLRMMGEMRIRLGGALEKQSVSKARSLQSQGSLYLFLDNCFEDFDHTMG
jgi:hypothetical protein